MNGSRGRANNFLLDGTDMNDGYRNDPAINEAGVFGDPATILPIDAVAELRMHFELRSGIRPQQRGRGQHRDQERHQPWHGSALEYFRTGQFGARELLQHAREPKNPFHNNQFGGSLGGPIIKDKTFFYFNYEGQREIGAQAGQSCVPDPAVIAQARRRHRSGRDPESGDGGAAGAKSLADSEYRGRRQRRERAAATNNVSTSINFFNRMDSLIGKIDHNFNANNLLTGRYYFGDSTQSFPFAQLAGGLLPGFNTHTPTRVQLVSISYVKVVNSNQLNEARLGWNRFAEGFFPEDQSFNPTSIGLNTGVIGATIAVLPKISVGGFSSDRREHFGAAQSRWIPTGTSSTTIRGSRAGTTSSSDTSSAARPSCSSSTTISAALSFDSFDTNLLNPNGS